MDTNRQRRVRDAIDTVDRQFPNDAFLDRNRSESPNFLDDTHQNWANRNDDHDFAFCDVCVLERRRRTTTRTDGFWIDTNTMPIHKPDKQSIQNRDRIYDRWKIGVLPWLVFVRLRILWALNDRSKIDDNPKVPKLQWFVHRIERLWYDDGKPTLASVARVYRLNHFPDVVVDQEIH
jgi:hypothetical protein